MGKENLDSQIDGGEQKVPQDLEEIMALEEILVQVYPDLDLSQDPAEALLSGDLKDKTEQFIDNLFENSS